MQAGLQAEEGQDEEGQEKEEVREEEEKEGEEEEVEEGASRTSSRSLAGDLLLVPADLSRPGGLSNSGRRLPLKCAAVLADS
jgi:hypothetical protein